MGPKDQGYRCERSRRPGDSAPPCTCAMSLGRVSKQHCTLYREGVNERKFTSACDMRPRLSRLRNAGHLPNPGVRAASAAGTSLRSQEPSGISLARLSQAPCGFAGRGPGAVPRVDARFLHRSFSAAPERPRDCKTLLRSRFLRSRRLEKLLRHAAAYTDPALESRPLTGFNSQPRNGVIATIRAGDR